MTEVKEEVKEEVRAKIFIVYNSNNLLTKYKICDADLSVYLINGKKITGKLRWYDDYAIKLIMPDGSGSVTIPIHNIVYYECDHKLLDGEQDKIAKVFRGVPKCTNKEKNQLAKYKNDNELIHFYLEDGIEVRGRLKWYVDYLYCIKPENEDSDLHIIKRHILYYKKIESPKPDRSEQGTIKALVKDRGFGFISSGKDDIFFHFSELEDPSGNVEIGQKVKFAIKENPKGKVAINIGIS
jgi:cold shock CspA family protein/sRNA-binding regulator protein Hfq